VTLTIEELPPPPPPVEAGAPVIVEVESSTGRGIVETDATASGGQVHAFSLSGVFC
jgi:hypothetical protein